MLNKINLNGKEIIIDTTKFETDLIIDKISVINKINSHIDELLGNTHQCEYKLTNVTVAGVNEVLLILNDIINKKLRLVNNIIDNNNIALKRSNIVNKTNYPMTKHITLE